jgi:hypothetical protein
MAQNVDDFGRYQDPAARPQASTQNFTLELRVGPYLPRVDSEFSDRKPFERFYGTKNRVALGFEFDWLPLEIRNTLRFGPGVGMMYTHVGADAFIKEDPESRAAGQTTSLSVFPHWVAAVLRFDALARRTPIPIVFAAKAGLAQALWWTSDEPRNSPAYDGTKGRGRSYGYYYGAGAMFDFGFLDSTRSKRLDAFLGINNIYFFGEFYALELSGFGGDSAMMRVGDRSWVLGLAFDL